MSVEATRAAIREAQEKVDALLKARDDASDAIDEISNTEDDLDLPSAFMVGLVASRVYAGDYIRCDGNGSSFEFDNAKRHIDETRELFEALVRKAPVPA